MWNNIDAILSMLPLSVLTPKDLKQTCSFMRFIIVAIYFIYLITF